MLALIEIASSGLGPDSYPVAVAWSLIGRGRPTQLLIRPAPTWRGWQREAEAAHGITRERLERDGVPVAEAAAHLARELGAATVFSDAVRLDQAWLDRLFAEVPGGRAPALRRFAELFPGAAGGEIDQALRDAVVPPQASPLLDKLGRRLLVAERYLEGMRRGAPRGRR